MAKIKEQLIPLILTVLTFVILCFLLYVVLLILNWLPLAEKVLLKLRLSDVLVGITIYIKTAVDFALLIANLMKNNNGWKKRISIEAGTAIGNFVGTVFILIIWVFFKDIPLLLLLMILISSFVLIKMSQESLEDFLKNAHDSTIKNLVGVLYKIIVSIDRLSSPLVSRIVPSTRIINTPSLPFIKLFGFSLIVPFILGLDNFAGYIPLFSVVNVFGFCIGAFFGHMFLNVFLFLSPKRTVLAVENNLIVLLGGLAFVGIAIYGFYESIHLLLEILHL